MKNKEKGKYSRFDLLILCARFSFENSEEFMKDRGKKSLPFEWTSAWKKVLDTLNSALPQGNAAVCYSSFMNFFLHWNIDFNFYQLSSLVFFLGR